MIKAAVILIYNSKGDLALQLRAAGDNSYPLHWDFSAGGGLNKGEDPKSAAYREVQEELGISISLTQIGVFSYGDVNLMNPSYVYNGAKDDDKTMIFQGFYDGEFSPNQKEVQEIRLVSKKTLASMLKKGDKFHPEFLYTLTKTFVK